MAKPSGRSSGIGNSTLLATAMLAALGFYSISLKVSSERAAVDKLRMQVVANNNDIRLLQSELRTRARLPELERWNATVLALSPPSPRQFVGDGVQLASYAPGAASPALPATPVPAATAPAATAAPVTAAPLLPVAPPSVRQLAPGMKSINYTVPNSDYRRLPATVGDSVALARPGNALARPGIVPSRQASDTAGAIATPAAGLDPALIAAVEASAAAAPAKAPMQ